MLCLHVQEVRQAILRPQLVQQPPAAAVEPPTPTRGAPQPHLVLRAACPLPPGLVLHRGLLLPSTRDADALMSRYGPEALALVKQQQQQQQEGQQQQQQQHGGRTGLPSHHSALGPPLHSLVITPAEQQDEAEDQEEEELAGGEGAAGPGGLRLRLLQQCGVGAVHYLGPGERVLHTASTAACAVMDSFPCYPVLCPGGWRTGEGKSIAPAQGQEHPDRWQ